MGYGQRHEYEFDVQWGGGVQSAYRGLGYLECHHHSLDVCFSNFL